MNGPMREMLKRYRVVGRGRECFARTTTSRHEIVTDTPKAQGGSDLSAEPVETLLAALIGCEQATAHFVARHLRLRIERIDFEIHAVRDAQGSMARPITSTPAVPAQLTAIWGAATVVTDATPSQITQLGHIVHERCPVASMIIASGCKLDIAWLSAPE